MMRLGSKLTVLLSLSLLAGAAPSDLIQRAGSLADDVKSYTAEVHADVALHTFPYLSPSLDGTYYHKVPNKNKVVFTSGLPFIAKQFSKVYPEVPSPSQWQQLYDISTESEDGSATTFKLVPRKHSRIDHIDAKIDDKTAEVLWMRWNYNDGGYAELNQQYGNVGGHSLVVSRSGKFDTPHYNADMKSTFSGFKVNVDIPDSVFSAE